MSGSLDIDARLMAEHGISFNGRHYQHRAHRCALLADAVKAALAQRAHEARGGSGPAPRQAMEMPTQEQRRVMATLAIIFRDGAYHSAGYSYDRLTDALAYTNLKSTP
jgi:hypothetical protein